MSGHQNIKVVADTKYLLQKLAVTFHMQLHFVEYEEKLSKNSSYVRKLPHQAFQPIQGLTITRMLCMKITQSFAVVEHGDSKTRIFSVILSTVRNFGKPIGNSGITICIARNMKFTQPNSHY